MSTKRDTLAKCWTYTINNWVRKDVIPDELCKYRIQGYEVGAEGTPHIQGYVHFIKEKRFSALKKLCDEAHWEKAKGTSYQNFIYCSKDKDYDEFGSRPRPTKKECNEEDITFAEALAANTVTEGIRIVKEKRPRDYCLHGDSIERNLKRHKQPIFQHKFKADDFNIGLQPVNKSTLIYGESNTGKTHYACAHFSRPLVCSHIDDLRDLSPDNDGIIFDDMSFKHWPPESIIHLLDTDFDRSINVRYGTITIPARTRKIFTHNTDNPFYCSAIQEQQREAIERRYTSVHVHNRLF